MINLGSVQIDNLRLGANQVAGIYIGSALVWRPDIDGLPAGVYFSATGNDQTGTGTSGAPFKSIEMANAVGRDGRTLYFRGGDTFVGTLRAAPGCVYRSYGTGKATISSGAGAGIVLENTSGAEARSLIFVGSGTTVNPTHGIYALNSFGGKTQVADVVVDSCEVRGYGRNGIFATVDNYPSGFTNLDITNNLVEDCTGNDVRGHTGGIVVAAEEADFWGLGTYPASHVNVTATGNTVRDCKGKQGANNHVGSGILVAQTRTGLLENNLVEDCGINSTNNAGPVAVWCWDSVGVKIRKNTVNRMRSGRSDGGAFDIDGGCQDCLMEYNFSTGCTGPGMLMFSFSDVPWPDHKLLDYKDNTCRYNISVRDGQTVRSNYGMFIGTMRPVYTDFQNINIHNNTVVVATVGAFSPLAFGINTYQGVSFEHATGVVCNNIFLQKGAGLICDIRATGLKVLGNCFHSVQGTAMRSFGFDWFDIDQFISSSGKEFLHGCHTVFFQDPELVNDAGSTAASMRPSAGSPAYGVAFDVTAEFGIAKATEDFLGTALPATQRFFTPGALEPVSAPANLLTSPNDVSGAGWFRDTGASDVITGLSGMFGGTSAQKIQVQDGQSYAAVEQEVTFASGTAKVFRRGAFVKSSPALAVPCALIGSYGANASTDYWYTWFDIVTGALNNAEALGTYLVGADPNYRVQKRPNGFWMVCHEMKVPSAVAVNWFAALPSNKFPTYGVEGNNSRGLVHDGFFDFNVTP
jgi:hypothetical protein